MTVGAKAYFKSLNEEMAQHKLTCKDDVSKHVEKIVEFEEYGKYIDLTITHPLIDAVFLHEFTVYHYGPEMEQLAKRIPNLSDLRKLELINLLTVPSVTLSNSNAWRILIEFFETVPETELIKVINKMPKICYDVQGYMSKLDVSKELARALLKKVDHAAISHYDNLLKTVSATGETIPGFSDFCDTIKSEFLSKKDTPEEYVKKALRAASKLKGFRFDEGSLIHPIKYEYYKNYPVDDFCELLSKMLNVILEDNIKERIKGMDNIELPPVEELEGKFAMAFLKDSTRKDYFNGMKQLVQGCYNLRKVGMSVGDFFYSAIRKELNDNSSEVEPWTEFQEKIIRWVRDNANESDHETVVKTSLEMCLWLGTNYGGSDVGYCYNRSNQNSFPEAFTEKHELQMTEWLRVMKASKVKPKLKNLDKMFGLL